jgi:small subunit ribosomal protein S14
MAKKSLIARQIKREKLVLKYKLKRKNLKIKIKKEPILDEKLNLYTKLQKLPRNSSFVRLKNRCSITGRPKAYYRNFGLSRHVLREMAHQCLLPGLYKSSW